MTSKIQAVELPRPTGFIRENLDKVLRYTPEFNEEAVLSLLDSGLVNAVEFREENDPVGFLLYIINKWTRPWSLEIFMAYSKPGHMAAHLDSYRDWLDRWVPSLGCGFVQMTSGRKGWGRVAKRLGFLIETRSYAKITGVSDNGRQSS